MSKQKTVKKTFSLPQYISSRLDNISDHTGYSQSNLVLQALTAFLHRFEQEETLENWVESLGRTSGYCEGAE